MNWFQTFGIWACKIKVADGRYKTMSSGVKASKQGLKWKEEKKSIRTEAEKVIVSRLAVEGIEVQNRIERSFDEVCSMYKENYRFDKYRMSRIEKEFSGKMIVDITSLDVRRFHNKVLETSKPSTWNRYRNQLMAIFNRAIEWGYCENNPVKTIHRYPEKKVEQFLSAEQSNALLDEARKEDFYLYAIILFALKTGRRVSEILDLEWDDVDFGAEVIRYRVRKKKGGHETIYRKPPTSVFQMLFVLKRENKEKPFPSFPRRAWRKVRDKVEKEVGLPDRRFHGLRHRCATEMIENGATLYDAQYYLHHSNPATTMIYAHVSKKRDEKIASFLE